MNKTMEAAVAQAHEQFGAKHTPEPWRVSKYDQHRVTSGSTEVAQDDLVCRCDVIPRGRITDGDIDRQRQADARRVVACVNACAGVPIDWLETNHPICLVGPPASESLQRMRTQRDELAAVLRKIMNAHNSKNNGAYMGEATVCQTFATEANAALAKVSA